MRPNGGIGRRNGLKIHRLTAMSVRVRLWAPYKKNRFNTLKFVLNLYFLVYILSLTFVL